MRIQILCLTLLLSVALTLADDPKQVALDYHDAIISRDVERVRMMALVPKDSTTEFEAQIAQLVSDAAVEAAAKKRFEVWESPARHPRSDAALQRRGLQNAEVVIEGDVAVLKTGTNPDARRLQRVDGKWRVDWQHYQRAYSNEAAIAACGLVYSKRWTGPTIRANERLLKELNAGTIVSMAQLSELRGKYVLEEQYKPTPESRSTAPTTQPEAGPASAAVTSALMDDLNAAYGEFFNANAALYKFLSERDGVEAAREAMSDCSPAEIPSRGPAVKIPVRVKDPAARLRNRDDADEVKVLAQMYRARAAARTTVLEELTSGKIKLARRRLEELDYNALLLHVRYKSGQSSPASQPAR